MSERLPPLTALRAFDAAARHMSFQNAAAELNVTPAALSFQIKSLEDHLGTQLFRRLNRAVELTRVGEILAPGAREGFEVLTAAWQSAVRQTDSKSLTITSGPAFTSAWLAHNLYSFAMAHPEFELSLNASLKMADLNRGDADIAVRFTREPPNNLYSEHLLDELMTPMMTPELASKCTSPDLLAEMPLIHQSDLNFLKPRSSWSAWFQVMGIERTDFSGMKYSNASHAVEAAISGAGILLGRVSLTVRPLKDGRLVAPFRQALKPDACFWILCARGTETQPRFRAFRDWLRSELNEIEGIVTSLNLEHVIAQPSGGD